MSPTNFHIAPPPKTVDGLLAVPIDIQSVTGTILFDAAAQSASADMTMSYTVGPDSGNPIFDLRQTISSAWLDGSPISSSLCNSHDFGAGSFSRLRIIESIQAAGSVHTLRVVYPLNIPDSQLGGAYPPQIMWSPGPRLRFVFGLSDLNAGRYAEAWLPANLIFDQFSIALEIRLFNTFAAHTVITNATLTVAGTNHWHLLFPDRFTAISPLLEIRATDTLNGLTDTVSVPVSGKTITIEAWKPSDTPTNLVTQIDMIKSNLIDNETDYGPYLHGTRFTALFSGGGMEYDGGTTTSPSALLHETFHSWFARGIKPARQADGWWDEAFTSYHDDGANVTLPFDFTAPPVLLCSRNHWQRRTPGNSYDDGNRFFKGLASLLGVVPLNTLMADLYKKYKGQPVTTEMIEEFLISKSGTAQIVDAFHQFVYGFSGSTPAPNLWLRDDTADPGADTWGGAFWNSPDLWIRRSDDDGLIHQPPEYGQDNWFYARVRNKNSAGFCNHFVITFHAQQYAGTEFVYPQDFLPAIAAKAEFDLGPGESRIVKACWPRITVPPAGSHPCILASIHARGEHPTNGKHVWEHNNLAQKNLTVVDLEPNWLIIIPVVISNRIFRESERFDLEVTRDRKFVEYETGIVHRSKEFFSLHKEGVVVPFEHVMKESKMPKVNSNTDCGAPLHHHDNTTYNQMYTSQNPQLIAARFPGAFLAQFSSGKSSTIAVHIDRWSPVEIGLMVKVPKNARIGDTFTTHLVQRHTKTKTIMGGIAVQIRVGKGEKQECSE